MYSWLAINWTVNTWSLLTTRHTSLPAPHWPQSCLLKASYSWSHFSALCNLLRILCATQKHVHMIWCYLYTLGETFQVFVMEFSPTRPKISGLFIPRCSLLNNLKKKRSKRKEKKEKKTMVADRPYTCFYHNSKMNSFSPCYTPSQISLWFINSSLQSNRMVIWCHRLTGRCNNELSLFWPIRMHHRLKLWMLSWFHQ